MAVEPSNCSPSPSGAWAKTSQSRKRTCARSPLTPTAPVISACALIAFQSAKATGASKLDTRAMCAAAGTSRKRPVPARSSMTTWVIRAGEVAPPPPPSGTKAGTANGIGSTTPSVISILSGACAAAANGPQRQRRRHADQQVAPEAVYHDTIPSGLKTTSMLRHCAYLSRGRSA